MGLRKGLSNTGPGEHKEQCYRGCAIYTFSYEGSMVCLASRQKNEEKDVEAVEESKVQVPVSVSELAISEPLAREL